MLTFIKGNAKSVQIPDLSSQQTAECRGELVAWSITPSFFDVKP